MGDESWVIIIKEIFNCLFMVVSWGVRFGGKVFVIFDDLDKFCLVEIEF